MRTRRRSAGCYTIETIETEGLLGGDEHVARAAHRLDHPRMRRVDLHLAPQPGDADVDRAVEGLPFPVAGHAEELVTAEHLVRMLDQRPEQVELHRRDRNLAAPGIAQSARLEIEEAVADADAAARFWRILLLKAPKDALQTGAQLARIEGLGDVVVGADLEAGDAVDHVGGAGDHDDADLVVLAQEARQGQAVLAGKADVEQDDRRAGALHLGAHGHTARRLRHRVAVIAEIVGEHLSDRRIVVDDQHLRRFHHCSLCERLYKPETNRFPREIRRIRRAPSLRGVEQLARRSGMRNMLAWWLRLQRKGAPMGLQRARQVYEAIKRARQARADRELLARLDSRTLRDIG